MASGAEAFQDYVIEDWLEQKLTYYEEGKLVADFWGAIHLITDRNFLAEASPGENISHTSELRDNQDQLAGRITLFGGCELSSEGLEVLRCRLNVEHRIKVDQLNVGLSLWGVTEFDVNPSAGFSPITCKRTHELRRRPDFSDKDNENPQLIPFTPQSQFERELLRSYGTRYGTTLLRKDRSYAKDALGLLVDRLVS